MSELTFSKCKDGTGCKYYESGCTNQRDTGYVVFSKITGLVVGCSKGYRKREREKEIDLKCKILREFGTWFDTDNDSVEQILTEGSADFVSLCRPLIREPNLPNRWLKGIGESKVDCIYCNGCLSSLVTTGLQCVKKETSE